MKFDKKFSRENLEAVNEKQRTLLIEELELYINVILSKLKNREEFLNCIKEVIQGLKEIDHDLWSQDYDGSEIEWWGGNYCEPFKTRGKLLMKFTYFEGVKISWEQNS